ncbi:MAG: N-acyl-D-amino-acid deacylase family protein [Planctomycetota bacterium]
MTSTADIVIRGGQVLDGLGTPPQRRDVAVSDGRIRLVEPPRRAEATEVIDATDLFVAPGFIDIHGHSDLASLICPDATSRVAAGVTTECSGNCGSGAFPMVGDVLAERRKRYDPSTLTLDWTDAAGYVARADAVGCAVNRATLVGHGNVRGGVIGYGNRRATPAEIDRMAAIVEAGLDAGALGLSTGLIYPPGMWADVDELAALAAVVAGRGGLYASHIRCEGPALLEAVDEFLEVLRRSGCRGQLSHVKASGEPYWPKLGAVGERLRRARAEGIDVWADRYPYTASRTSLAAMVLPAEAMAGSTDDVVARLAEPGTRRTIVEAVRAAHAGWLDRWLETIVIATVGRAEFRDCIGRTLRDLPDRFAAAGDGLDAAVELLVADRAAPQAVRFCMSEANLRAVYGWDFVCVGSDSAMRDHLGDADAERPHPRSYGTPGRFVDVVVRRWKLMDWPEAIRRMTAMPAAILGLTERGVLRDGAPADVVVFDPRRFADRATYDDPGRPPDGIVATLVNGQVVWQHDRHTGRRPGRLLGVNGTR